MRNAKHAMQNGLTAAAVNPLPFCIFHCVFFIFHSLVSRSGARMRDERQPNPAPPPLAYQSPGAHAKSQWITDEGAGGKWLVGCLIVLSVAGAVVAGVVGVAWFFLTGW
jgi:hypothetical protein